MTTPIPPQLLSASPKPATPGRGSDALDSSPAESFGQVMARVGQETKPRSAAANTRHDGPPNKPGGRDAGEAAQPGKAARDNETGHRSEAAATAEANAEKPSRDTQAPVEDDSNLATEPSASTQAAGLIEALLVSVPAPAVQPAKVDVALAQAATRTTADAQVGDPAEAPAAELSAAGEPAIEDSAAVQEHVVTKTPPAAAGNLPPSSDPAGAHGDEIKEPVKEAAAAALRMQPAVPGPLNDQRRQANGEDPITPARESPAAAPQRAPIAEALATLATKSGERDASAARTVVNEHSFEQLLGSRALSAPRAEPAVQAVPFAHLLSSPTTTQATPAIVSTPVGQPGFAQDVGDRLLMLATGQVKSAELALTPAELGPVRVSIEVRGQDASITFVAAAAATRTALEEALPRLREMFNQQGLNLLDAHVDAQVGQQGQRAYGRQQAIRSDGRADGETAAVQAVAGTTSTGSGRPVRLIDVIA